MKLVPNQPFFYGDIIFCVTLVLDIAASRGLDIYWPVREDYLQDFKRAYPTGVTWVSMGESGIDFDRRDEYIMGDKWVVPLRWAAEVLGMPYKHTMRAKYDLCGHNYTTWANGAMFERNREREERLCELVGMRLGMDVINENFSAGEIAINRDGIRMGKVEGFSLFDWALVLEMAGEIHTVSTSLFYVISLLGLMDKTVIYPRLPFERDLTNISDLIV